MTQFSAHFQKDAAFGEAVRKRVFEYMKENDLSKRANAGMISKTLLFFGLYVTIFLGLLWNPFHSLVWMFLSYGSLGILLGTIGMNIICGKSGVEFSFGNPHFPDWTRIKYLAH
jgi:hypothetical protein